MFIVFSFIFDKAKNKSKIYIKNCISSNIIILSYINICKRKLKIDLFLAINQKCIKKKWNKFYYQYFV